MVTQALPAAYAALKLGASGDTGFDEGMFEGRDVTHWSSHLLMAGSVVGLITLLGGIALGQMVVAIQGGILLGTNAIGAYYINKFSVFHEAGEVIQALANRIHTFWKQVAALQKQVRRAGRENEKLHRSVDKIARLIKEKERLNKSKEQVVKELETVQAKLAQVTRVCQPMVQSVDQFIQATANLSESGHNLERNIELLMKNIRSLSTVRNGLHTEIAELEEERKIFANQKIEIEEAIMTIENMVKSWPQKYHELKQQNKSLKEDVDALQVAVEQMQFTNEKLNEIKLDFENKIIPALKEGVPNTRELKRCLHELKKKLDV